MKILFRTDASAAIGLGHAMRCLALAQTARAAGHACIFVMAPGASAMEQRLQEENCEVAPIATKPGGKEDAAECVKIARAEAADFIIVDGYHFDSAYQASIRKGNIPFLFIDDYGHGTPYTADLILNQNCYAPRHAKWYENRPAASRLLLGCTYTMLRREFLSVERQKKELPDIASSVLVTMGGGDPKNATRKVLQALQSIREIPLQITVVVGSTNPHRSQIESARGDAHIIVDTKDMPHLMMQTDACIAAGGTTSYELAYLGVPSLLCVLAENQRSVAEDLKKRKVAELLGNPLDLPVDSIAQEILRLLKNREERLQYAVNGRALIDGKGSERVLAAMLDSL
ncbi:MAG: UDP-2,4-diacetamido-2,4,6-trideoxy-beta-L-altropyranose hydrolase [Candidatus Peribacteraceae bacterium]|nr:UDP-2,4-diacetamido-2,4,6-trideoxy-beta-L-altropyranose hydrolase [Candidatus Peribacteraceae bacterium]MDD5740044.1 UDP-2,4-diacetamido-2,4,6-trideoxy-beta-L-altropyranose hydrolase [Candidatus Peribacteraceae bacterium]